MGAMDGEMAEIAAVCTYCTAKAIQCDVGLGDPVWVPRSLIHEDSEVLEPGDTGILVVPEWFAEKEGMI